MDEHGVPARELSDEQLEQQGAQAHATRNWVFLHGTAEQFQRHTERMLELEQEYLRRYPKRTWQGAAGDEPVEIDEATRLRHQAAHGRTQIASAPEGRMHRLEVHQAARRAGISRAALAQMYRSEPPLLRAEGHDRLITDQGRALAER
jgi:hypothetical protein